MRGHVGTGERGQGGPTIRGPVDQRLSGTENATIRVAGGVRERQLGQHAVLPLPVSGDGGKRLAVGTNATASEGRDVVSPLPCGHHSAA